MPSGQKQCVASHQSPLKCEQPRNAESKWPPYPRAALSVASTFNDSISTNSGSRTSRNSTLNSAASSASLAARHTAQPLAVRLHRSSQCIDQYGESAHQSGPRTNRCQSESAPSHCGAAPDSVAADRCAPTMLAFAHQSDHLCVGFPQFKRTFRSCATITSWPSCVNSRLTQGE
jgi:hypothetical protein